MALSRPELLACRRLRVGFKSRTILPSIDVTIRAGQFWAVVGRNGAGKTSWLRTLIGLVPPLAGSVDAAPGVRVSYLPQRGTMDELYPLAAREVVSIGAQRGWSFLGGLGAAERRQRVARALAEVGAEDLAERPFRRLSEGQNAVGAADRGRRGGRDPRRTDERDG
jgi:zinc transport system ATP-binding protein